MTKSNISSQIDALLDSLDSQEDIANATQLIHKRFFERALNAELDEHLGYEKHNFRKGSNARNGVTSKTLYTEDGQLDIDTPRDRDGSFQPERGALQRLSVFARAQDKSCARVASRNAKPVFRH